MSVWYYTFLRMRTYRPLDILLSCACAHTCNCYSSEPHPKIMDAPRQLDSVRMQIVVTAEWKAVNHQLQETMREGMAKREKAHSKGLDVKARAAVVKSACLEMEGTKEYASLQAKVSEVVKSSFTLPKGASNSGEDKKSDLLSACSLLLHKRPEFSRHLKRCLNCPLHPGFRPAAWGALLRNKKVREEFYEEIAHRNRWEIDSILLSRCRVLLSARPLLSQFAATEANLMALHAVLHYWERKSPRDLADVEIFLCVPFVYLHGNKIVEHSKLNRETIASAVEMYITFMGIIPPNMKSIFDEVWN